MRAVLLLLALVACRAAGPEPGEAPVGPQRVAAERAACTAGGGRWVAAPSGAMICQRPTRDGGAQCSAAGDCEGACLARSRSCAPVTPLFGCTAVLGAAGAPSTVCRE